ncbi:MAG TPA: glycoside hydrolase family 2 TIM barrel-domain containing protein [Kofleriaceae bacterium]|nr:glycoside hydrolase family 2 TIM barrel-domain containing protein [Kofleriaceae bacterium]
MKHDKLVEPDAEMVRRGEHPRPQLQRDRWRSLDGTWQFAFEPAGAIRRPEEVRFDRTIVVPFAPESEASTIHDTGFHAVMWYRLDVRLTPAERTGCLLLHFGAVDYQARVWVNGALVAEHRGGHTPFTADVTAARGDSDVLRIVVRADDDPHDLAKPRGKQDWLESPHEIWYARTSGIWQTVWLEPVPDLHIQGLRWEPHLDRWEMGVEVHLNETPPPGTSVRVRMHRAGQVISDDRYELSARDLSRRIGFADPGIDDHRNRLLWSPAHPTLITADVELWQGDRLIDATWSYTALRSIDVQGNRLWLNGRPFFLRMVLDQGYWPDTVMTPRDTGALRKDVELARSFGFNGVRKHQKIEDPRWLYWCDIFGLLVWVEMPSPYRFTIPAVERLVAEWIEVIHRDRSHPCVAAWVPLNESWGVPDLMINPAHRDYVRALYHLTKTLDPTRPVVGNDGWEHVATDIVTIHDYASNPRILRERYASAEAVEGVLDRQQPGGRALAVQGFAIEHRPVVLSEFGGIAALTNNDAAWGYSKVGGSNALLEAYSQLLAVVHDCRGLAGFCYTQLADTFQEQNGLATADRVPKAEVARIAAATRGTRRATAIDYDPDPVPSAPPDPTGETT